MSNEIVIAGNWKMNPSTMIEAIELTQNIIQSSQNIPKYTKVVLFVPLPFLYPISKLLENTNILLGAQDCYTELSGAYTGAVSISMLKSLGCSYVLSGHSEKRNIFNDTNCIINKKVKRILESDLHCILCIGENKEEFEKGLNKEICDTQLRECLLNCKECQLNKVIIAYEPIWAIGSGLNATPEIIEDVHKYIRNWFKMNYSETVSKKMCIQYGGSVNSNNFTDILNQDNVNGVLIGGASLDSDKFSKIMNY